RLTRAYLGDSVYLPSAEHFLAQQAQAMNVRGHENIRRDEFVWHVYSGGTPAAEDIVAVDDRAHFHRLRPHIGERNREVLVEVTRQCGLQRVVRSVAVGNDIGDGGVRVVGIDGFVVWPAGILLCGAVAGRTGAGGTVDWRILVDRNRHVTAHVAYIGELRTPTRAILLLQSEAELLNRRNVVIARLKRKDVGSRKENSIRRAGLIGEWICGRIKRIDQIGCVGDRHRAGERLLDEIVRYRHLINCGVEQTVGAAQRSLTVAEHVVRKAEAWSKGIPGRVLNPVGNPLVPRKHESRRSGWETRRLLARNKCRGIVLPGVHREIFPAKAKVQRQTWRNLPVILQVDRGVLRMTAEEDTVVLRESGRLSQQEVHKCVLRTRASREGEQTIGRCAASACETIPHVGTAKLQLVTAKGPDEVLRCSQRGRRQIVGS